MDEYKETAVIMVYIIWEELSREELEIASIENELFCLSEEQKILNRNAISETFRYMDLDSLKKYCLSMLADNPVVDHDTNECWLDRSKKVRLWPSYENES